MIAALAGLLSCQLAGEILVRGLGLPLPGPVAGLGLLFAFLVVQGRRSKTGAVPEALGQVSDAFMRNLSILFIPASVGIVQYLGLLRQFAVPIALTIVLSTTVTLAITAATFRLASRALGRRPVPTPREPGEDRPDTPPSKRGALMDRAP